MSGPVTCDVCSGLGVVPIYGSKGDLRHNIQCPECFGTGMDAPVVPPIDETDLPPRSTAARITTPEQLALHVAEHNRRAQS